MSEGGAKRDTATGTVLENMVVPALSQAGYEVKQQVVIGRRLGAGRHKVDAVAEKDGQKFIISLKWQQVSGTAEQKVPFEVICLTEALATGSYAGAYLVLGGEGWSLRSLYTEGQLRKWLNYPAALHILSFEGFVALVNRGML
jgi:hypothetical protein